MRLSAAKIGTIKLKAVGNQQYIINTPRLPVNKSCCGAPVKDLGHSHSVCLLLWLWSLKAAGVGAEQRTHKLLFNWVHALLTYAWKLLSIMYASI